MYKRKRCFGKPFSRNRKREEVSIVMIREKSALQKARAAYQPKLPKALRSGRIRVEFGAPTQPVDHAEEIAKLFPHTYGQPAAKIVEGESNLNSGPLKVGVVLSGGQASGGHNVIAGLFDALKAANADSTAIRLPQGPGRLH